MTQSNMTSHQQEESHAVKDRGEAIAGSDGNRLAGQYTFMHDVERTQTASWANGVRAQSSSAGGSSSHEAFAFIVHVTGDEVDEEADDWIHHYYVSKVQGLTTTFVVALIVGVLGVLVGNVAGGATISLIFSWLASFVVLAGIIVFIMVNITKKRIAGKIITTLESGRDPVMFCGRYLAYLREKEPQDLLTSIWLYSKGLRWQGRWDDAQRLFECYLERFGMIGDARAQHLHHQLLAGIAFDKERYNEMLDELSYLKSIPQEGLPQTFAKDVELLHQLAQVLGYEREGKKQEAYDLVESFFYHSENVLRMALALHLGVNSSNRTDALEWINFVIKLGMSTWCVKKAKAIRASGKLQKLPKGESRFGMNVRERRKEAKRKRKEAAQGNYLNDAADSLPDVSR